MRVLVVADMASGADRLERALIEAGYDAVVKERLAEAEHLLLCERFEALVFRPAFTDPYFVERMRRDHPTRALIAWLRSSSSSRVAELLEPGVDEVLDGTMDDRELVARIRNAGRHGRRPTERVLELGELRIVRLTGETSWRGEALPLTRREREVLQALAEAGGEPVRREVLYRQIWGYSMVRGDRSVDVNVKRLRDKLAGAGVELHIRTAPKIGYRLELSALAEPGDLAITAL